MMLLSGDWAGTLINQKLFCGYLHLLWELHRYLLIYQIPSRFCIYCGGSVNWSSGYIHDLKYLSETDSVNVGEAMALLVMWQIRASRKMQDEGLLRDKINCWTNTELKWSVYHHSCKLWWGHLSTSGLVQHAVIIVHLVNLTISRYLLAVRDKQYFKQLHIIWFWLAVRVKQDLIF